MNEHSTHDMDSYHHVISVPITIGGLICKAAYAIFYFTTLPLRILCWFLTTFPVLSALVVLFLFALYFLARRLSRQSAVHYVLYTAIPYGLSIVYTGVTFFFPQVHTVTRICGALMNPIRFILGLIEKVDQRAKPIRRTVEAISPPKGRKAERKSVEEALNDGRLQCCVCVHKEKNIILRPCMHLCLCDGCLTPYLRHQNTCPICRSTIDGYDKVFL